MTQSSESAERPGRVAIFPSTHWSVIVQATGELGDEGARALEKLCRSYWYPLYAYVRRKGHSPTDAEDLTQEFFARLLHKNYLSTVDRKKGRFRSFLLASLEHFLAKEWTRAHRVKRGGRCDFIPFDEQTAESKYHHDSRASLTPEALYERSWALAVLDQTMERLAEECVQAGKAEQFALLKPFVSGDRGEQSYVETANRLQMSQGAARVAVHRLRARYGELLREQIAQTVVHLDEIDEEIRHLLTALSR